MSHTHTPQSHLFQPLIQPTEPHLSPLILADRLLTLAQDADRAGLPRPAERLLRVAYAMLNEKPH